MSTQTITLASPSAATNPPKPAIATRTKLLLEGPILPTLLRLSAPNVLNLLAIAGMITFDGLFMGRLGADALAGVSLAFPFVMLIQHTAASGMGGGVSSAIARASAPVSATWPTRWSCTPSSWRSALRRCFQRSCWSRHRRSSVGWVVTEPCSRPQ
jgi:hypothetical protein